MHSKSAVLFEAMNPEGTLHLLQDRGLRTLKRFVIAPFITCRAKLLNDDWLRQRAFFLNEEGTFGNQEGMIT